METHSPPDVPRSKHAEQRSRQRGLPQLDKVLEVALRYGTPYHAGEGCEALYISKASVQSARRDSGERIDDYQNLAAIVSASGLVTIYRCTSPRPHWRKAR